MSESTRTTPPEGSLMPPDPVDLLIEQLRQRAQKGRLVAFHCDFYRLPSVAREALDGIAGELERIADALLAELAVCRDRADRLAQELAEKKGELAVAYGSGGSAEETEWFSALDKAKAEVAAERDRADRAERENTALRKLLDTVGLDRAAIAGRLSAAEKLLAAGSVEGRDD